MPTSTPNYGFLKPNVNSADDEDLWGGQTNENWDRLDTLLASILPAGVGVDGYFTSAPSGWLMCDGSAVSRTTYANLFAAIGTTFGNGDGSTTFNLPDVRGRVNAGKDDMGGTGANRLTTAGSGVDGDTVGAVGGSEFMQEHEHNLTDPGHTHTLTHAIAVQGNGGGAGWLNGSDNSPSTSSATTGIIIDAAGTGDSQNIQPTIVCLKLIKT